MPPFYISTTSNRTHFKLTAYICMWSVYEYLMYALYSVIVMIFIIALIIYDAHAIYFYMDPARLVVLSQSYTMVCCWVWATLLHLPIITPLGAPNVWKYVWIFKGVVGYMLNDSPYYHIIIILHSLFPHGTTPFPLP